MTTPALAGSSWSARQVEACRRHPDLVAVYESWRGRLAILLRHTAVPIAEERTQWLVETARAAEALLRDLRGAGVRGVPIVLNWRTLEEIAHATRTWRLCYDADPARRRALAAAVETHLADRRWIAARETAASPDARRRSSPDASPRPLHEWYGDMIGCWLGAAPRARRHLVLRAHRWIARYLLSPARRAGGVLEAAERHGLAEALEASLLPEERPTWRPWMRLLMADLDRALRWPAAKRDDRWGRWLFLIPYALPTPAPRPARRDATGTSEPGRVPRIEHAPVRFGTAQAR